MNKETINTVAEAILEASDGYMSNPNIAKAAIGAMQIREMTCSQIQTILAKDMSKDAPEMEAYWYGVVEDGVRELAKLGTIKIVENL